MLRFLVGLLAWGLLLAVLVGFAERSFPVLDVIAAFRLHLAVLAGGLLVLAALFGVARSAWPAAAAAVIAAATLGPVWQPEQRPAAAEGVRVKVLAANLRLFNADPVAAGRALVEADADIILTAEATREMLEGAVAQSYPYSVMQEGKSTLRMTVWSRFPLSDGQVNLNDWNGPISAGAVARLGPETRLGVLGVHFLRGFDGKRSPQIEGIEEQTRRFDVPMVIAGDFNAAPWAELTRQVAERTGTVINGGHRVTWRGRYPVVDLPEIYGHQIDQVLVSPQIGIASIRTIPLPGSDHLGVLAELVVPPQAEPEQVAAEAPLPADRAVD